MAITIIGAPSTDDGVPAAASPLVELKRLWTDLWEIHPDLRVLHCTAASAGAEIGTCELVRAYGNVKTPWGSDYLEPSDVASKPVDWLYYWVRVRTVTTDGIVTIWTGRIGSEVREPYGDPDIPSGLQTFVAYEPAMMLENIMVGDSYWWIGDPLAKKQMQWCPAMNSRDERNFVVGNMARDVTSGEEFYGGTSEWYAFAAVWYLLRNFADAVGSRANPPTTIDGPMWSVTGQTDLLFELGDVITFEASENLLSILRRIINPKKGIDFTIRNVEEGDNNTTGFAIHVFALSAVEQNFAGVALPSNPNTIEINRSTATDVLSVKITRSAEHTVGRVRVMGARLVCVTTLYGEDESLERKWVRGNDGLSGDERAYREGTGTASDDAVDHDNARKADRFRDVYQAFGAPADWGHDSGLSAPVLILAGGELTLENAGQADPQYQNQVRNTLSWTPLRANMDYSVAVPVDSSGGLPSDLLAPMVWVWDEDTQRNVALDQVGIAISALQGDWGVHLNASPNHLLAKRDFNGGSGIDADTNTDPLYDNRQLAATIAFKTDQRLSVVYERVGGVRPHDGTVDIIDESAEFWFAPPHIIYAVDSAGAFLYTPEGVYLILRNDSARLFATMAGAISRYFHDRARADVMVAGLRPYSDLIGQVLSVIEESGDKRSIQAPVTAVVYDMSDPDKLRTRIRAGYAR